MNRIIESFYRIQHRISHRKGVESSTATAQTDMPLSERQYLQEPSERHNLSLDAFAISEEVYNILNPESINLLADTISALSKTPRQLYLVAHDVLDQNTQPEKIQNQFILGFDKNGKPDKINIHIYSEAKNRQAIKNDTDAVSETLENELNPRHYKFRNDTVHGVKETTRITQAKENGREELFVVERGNSLPISIQYHSGKKIDDVITTKLERGERFAGMKVGTKPLDEAVPTEAYSKISPLEFIESLTDKELGVVTRIVRLVEFNWPEGSVSFTGELSQTEGDDHNHAVDLRFHMQEKIGGRIPQGLTPEEAAQRIQEYLAKNKIEFSKNDQTKYKTVETIEGENITKKVTTESTTDEPSFEIKIDGGSHIHLIISRNPLSEDEANKYSIDHQVMAVLG